VLKLWDDAPEAAADCPLDRSALLRRAAETAHLSGGYARGTRERQVLELLAQGRTNWRIAKPQFITEKTVSVQVTHILAKLQVTNRAEPVR
jgi:DNA-binding NarL/FixJ family response regulator